MSPTPLTIVMLQTGETLASLKERRRGFREMFLAGLRDDGVAPSMSLRVVDVTAQSEHDPLLDLAAVDGVVMTGSPAMVAEDTPWMRWGARVINRAIDDEVPFLGVCFGHQLLGVARGADVGPNPRGREIGSVVVESFGTSGDALLHGMPGSFRAQVSHVDVIRDPGAKLEVLGKAPHDAAHIVRAGPVAWGVQFHPEFDEDVVLEYIRARHHMIDSDHGPGAADLRLGEVGPSPDALAVLKRFTRVCACRQGRSGHPVVGSMAGGRDAG